MSRRVHPFLIALLVSTIVGAMCVTEILARAGQPALPLDDSFIHLQYARRLSEGHFFSYAPGAGYSAGATSFLWPVLLAPFFWLGFDGLDIVWIVWAYGILFHAGVVYDTGRLARGLSGPTGGLAAASICVVFGGFAWFAWSGMETVLLAWVLVRTARVASEVCEGHDGGVQLAALGMVGPLVRPEGALCSLIAIISLALIAWRKRSARSTLWIAMPLVGPLLVPLTHRSFAGHSTSSTAMVKWLPLDPYADRTDVLDQVSANVRLLLTNLLDGGNWTAVFMPEHFVIVMVLGFAGMMWLAHRNKRWWRALFVLAIVFGTLGPTTYATMLWNRVRYVWPFAPGWFVLACCAPVALGTLLRRYKPLLEIVSPVLLGGLVAVFAAKLEWAISDVAQSARAISRQQVTLGRWAAAHLEPDARIGVNDTGAIAYMSRRSTFDVVGLTTEGEARYWAAGAGSRFEHYERMDPAALPSHFIVYPGWMRMPAVLGDWLTQASVYEQSILGGTTMVAYRARYDLLGSGATPDDAPRGTLLDELDIADLESEAGHEYTLGWARSALNLVRVVHTAERVRVDGGRLTRLEDRFFAALPEPSVMIMRVGGHEPLEVWLDGERVATVEPVESYNDWQERRVDLPASDHARSFVVVRPAKSGATFDSYHYWWFARAAD